jgi:hypothetical protein
VIFRLGRDKRIRVLKKIGAFQFLSTESKVSKIKKNNTTTDLHLRHDSAFRKSKLKKRKETMSRERNYRGEEEE